MHLRDKEIKKIQSSLNLIINKQIKILKYLFLMDGTGL